MGAMTPTSGRNHWGRAVASSARPSQPADCLYHSGCSLDMGNGTSHILPHVFSKAMRVHWLASEFPFAPRSQKRPHEFFYEYQPFGTAGNIGLLKLRCRLHGHALGVYRSQSRGVQERMWNSLSSLVV